MCVQSWYGARVVCRHCRHSTRCLSISYGEQGALSCVLPLLWTLFPNTVSLSLSLSLHVERLLPICVRAVK